MKKLTAILAILLCVAACSRQRAIDSVYPWPPSGVAEADSLMLRFERGRETLATPAEESHAVVERFCSIARRHPANNILRARSFYLETCTLLTSDPRKAYDRLVRELPRLDSIATDYDRHALRSLRLPQEKSIYDKYMTASANAEFFEKAGAEVELARNLILKGNALVELSDTSAALDCFRRAEELFSRHGADGGIYAIRLNRLPLLPQAESARQLKVLLEDSLVRRWPKLYVPALQTAYYMNDSVPLLDSAIAIASADDATKGSLPILLAMKATALVLDGEFQEALAMTGAIAEAEETYAPSTRYRPVIHNNLAMVYEANGDKDACIGQLVEAAWWTDSLLRESNYRKVYANEARLRIGAMESNARLRHRNLILWWIVTVIAAVGAGIALYLHLRRIAEKRRGEIRVLDEKIENERRLNFAQSSVLEQSERMVSDLESEIDSLSRSGHVGSEDIGGLKRILSAYRSNDESRSGFLKVSREVDTSFSRRLKQDYPDISESQLRLASLIAAGVDGHQLASILNISPKSLYTARYRLRTRLALPKDAGLEDFLRRYAGTSPEHSGGGAGGIA